MTMGDIIHSDMKGYAGSVLALLLNSWAVFFAEFVPGLVGIVVGIFTILHFWESIQVKRLERRRLELEIQDMENPG